MLKQLNIFIKKFISQMPWSLDIMIDDNGFNSNPINDKEIGVRQSLAELAARLPHDQKVRGSNPDGSKST